MDSTIPSFRRVWVINAEVCTGRLRAVCSWPRSPLLNYTSSGSSGDHGPPLPSDHHLITPTRQPKRGHWPGAGQRQTAQQRLSLDMCQCVCVSISPSNSQLKSTLSSYSIYKLNAFEQWFQEWTECAGFSYELVKWKRLDAKNACHLVLVRDVKF